MSDMNAWLKTAAGSHKPMPLLSFPGIRLIGATVMELVNSGELQAGCMKAIANRFDALASVSLMDLSVEAEAFGSRVHYSSDEVPTVTGTLITDEESLASLAIPDIGKARTGECIKAIREAKSLITDRPVFAGTIGPYSLAGRMLDITEIMILCYDDPDLVHAALEKATLFLIRYGEALRDAGADGVIMAEPAAGLLSPALIAEFSTPYVKRVVDAVQTDGFIYVYHNCGNTIPLIGSILNTGAKVLHFGNSINLAEMLQLTPRSILVSGNVDPARQFRNGTPESVRETTLDLLSQCAKYDNFILSSGCDIPPASPMPNVEAFFSAAKDFYM